MENVEDFCEQIGLNEETTEIVVSILVAQSDDFDVLVKKFLQSKNYKWVNKMQKAEKLALAVAIAIKQKEQYDKLGISEQIYFDTMSDITIWSQNCFIKFNEIGLDNFDWIKNHLKLELFKIGRLQYQFSKMFTPLNAKRINKNIKKPSFFSRTLFLHIPRAGKLDYGECVKSIIQAKAFFNEHFKKYLNVPIVTYTWLLYPKNSLVVNEDSNIMKFQTLFNVFYTSQNSHDFIEYVWYGEDDSNYNNLSERTSLQKKGKKCLIDGVKFGFGFGIVKDIL